MLRMLKASGESAFVKVLGPKSRLMFIPGGIQISQIDQSFQGLTRRNKLLTCLRFAHEQAAFL